MSVDTTVRLSEQLASNSGARADATAPAREPPRQRLKAAQAEVSARAALEALETLRVVDYDLPVATSSRILIFTRPTPAALALLRKLGLRLPKQLTLPVAA